MSSSSIVPRTIVITGASDGIGAAAARDLKTRGENVVIVGRSPQKTASVAKELRVPSHVADYTDLTQVRHLAAELDDAYPRIDVLANNAGGIMGHRTLTTDGYEKTFQVNHLAGFLLTQLLMPKLTASSATVIQTASAAAKVYADFDIEDLQNERSYTPQKAYGNAKLANILFTHELHRRYAEQGISAVAFHPGVVASNFASDTTHFRRFIYHTPIGKRLISEVRRARGAITPEKGADQLVWLAQATPGSDWQPGAYYDKREVAQSLPAAHDGDLARALWDKSEQMTQPYT